MKNFFRSVQFVAQFITLGLALAFVISLFSPQLVDGLRARLSPASTANEESVDFGPGRPESSTGLGRAMPTAESLALSSVIASEHQRAGDTVTYSYSRAVDRAAPAVVSIQANKEELRNKLLVPNDPILRAQIGGGYRVQQLVPTQSLGSGVIFNSDGYVLTSNHVIQNAKEISAVLGDGRIAKAALVGKDLETDLAVLKLDINHLPIIPVADRIPDVGDVVLAIGNPFGLNNTVTMGIVSARGRPVDINQTGIGQTSYEDFIQTDAAINQGNSGGALVNALGELVGINSRTYTPDGTSGNIGIGFAVPVNTAKTVLTQIIAHGHVVRGWMGVEYVDSLPSLDGSPGVRGRGIVVRAVTPDTPAAKAGMQIGDVLIDFQDRPIVSQFDLRTRESELPPGSNVHLSGIRDGKLFSADLTLEEKPQTDPTTRLAAPTG